MAQDFAKSFAEIVKFNKNDDGTLTVYGKATSDDLDIDLQICDNDWLKKAMPEWFKSGGNIREQHSSIAAGVATDYEEKNDGFYITANVVDPVSCKKVEARVLKGFSIGIKAPRVVRDEKAANGRIIDGQIVEVSLVDRPANPTCQLVLAKSVNGESTLTQVEELIEKGNDNHDETGRFTSGDGGGTGGSVGRSGNIPQGRDNGATQATKDSIQAVKENLDNHLASMQAVDPEGHAERQEVADEAKTSLNQAQTWLDRATTAPDDESHAEYVQRAAAQIDQAGRDMESGPTETMANTGDSLRNSADRLSQYANNVARSKSTNADTAKRDFSADERQDAADAGQALPDGSYPIKTVADLKNAIQAFGRAKDPAKVKQHIITRARALGAIDQLPEGWNVKKSPLLDVILELHEKANKPDSAKFEGSSYETVLKGIAGVLIKETGTDEDSEAVIEALKHVFDDQFSNKDADSDNDGTAGCECDGCAACKADGGCDADVCKGHDMGKSADIGKCLECGCNQVGQSHGQTRIVVSNTGKPSNVTTADMSLDTSGSIKSAEGELVDAELPIKNTDISQEIVDKIVAEAKEIVEEAQKVEHEIKTEILDEKSVQAIIEKAVQSATEIVKTEIISHEAALKAANEKVVALESELVAAKSAVVQGGPAKTGRKPSQDTNELLAMAIDYRLKAAATTDPTLIKGYKALEAEYMEKANKLNK